jgi:hypothetical protein
MLMRFKLGPIQRRNLTRHEVRKFGRTSKSITPSKKDKFWIIHSTSVMTLSVFLGKEWVEKNIFSERIKFLSAVNNNRRSILITERIIELAEMLFNLQYETGFFSVLERLKTAEIEATFAELEVARLLRQYKVKFDFNIPANKAKEDFDYNLYLNGTHVAADAKCKLETSEISAKGILGRLKKTQNEQLPKGKPGIIFLRLPENWPLDKETVEMIKSTIQTFFRSTTRVIAVVILRTMFDVVGKGVFNTPFYEVVENPRQVFGRDLLPLSKEWPLFSTRWIRFTTLLGYFKMPNYFEVEKLRKEITESFEKARVYKAGQ